MKTAKFYYFILFVYVCLWACQQIACHLTHSLIILTDSYINLYKILDISLGILHLRTQLKLANLRKKQDAEEKSKDSKKAEVEPIRLFNRACTFQFRRLPLLGSFVNGLFLAALLMSAAIEGIQTCFHAGHSEQDKATKSILLQHPSTYPAILVGFALVGLVMQWCSAKAHQRRDWELAGGQQPDGSSSTDSLFHSTVSHKPQRSQQVKSKKTSKLSVLDAGELCATNEPGGVPIALRELDNGEFVSIPLTDKTSDENLSRASKQDKRKSKFRNKSAESIPSDLGDSSCVSLKSLRIIPNLDQHNHFTTIKIASISSAGPPNFDSGTEVENLYSRAEAFWALVRFCTSPVALISCASIFSLNNHELVREFADAGLAIFVVLLLFRASYPPMKKAGRVLLQTSPLDVDPEALKQQLFAISPCIMNVSELHVWSLSSSAKDQRFATCHLVMNKALLADDGEALEILAEAKRKLKENRFDCSTVQLEFLEPATAAPTHLPSPAPTTTATAAATANASATATATNDETESK